MNNREIDIFCIGNALIETTIRVHDSFLRQIDAEKGRMYLINKNEHDKLLEKHLPRFESYLPAGAACNVATGVARFGGNSFFTGKIGNDEDGQKYARMLDEMKVKHFLVKGTAPTGKIFSFITPDNERTMFTYFGSSQTFSPHDLHLIHIQTSGMLFVSAFFLQPQELRNTALKVLEMAKDTAIPIAFDVADTMIISKDKRFITDILKNYVDIIFMNDSEYSCFSSLEIKEIKDKDSEKIIIVKKGTNGSTIYEDHSEIDITAVKSEVIDTTGAGDAFASGFLYSKTLGFDSRQAGEIGSRVASKVVSQYGSCLNMPINDLIKMRL